MNENWLFIKTPDYYGKPEIIEFDQSVIKYFELESDGESLMKIANRNREENITEIEHKFINPNRIRFFRNGKIHKVLSETESITEDCVFENANGISHLNPFILLSILSISFSVSVALPPTCI